MTSGNIGARDDAAGTRAGLSIAFATTGVFASMDALTKFVSATYSAPQILWIRYMVFAAYGLAVTVRRHGWHALHSNAPVLQIFRGLLLCGEILIFIVAFRHLPLADVQAVAGIGPLVATALAVPILNEKVGVRRWTAIGFGLIGLVIIIRPGFGSFEPMLLLPAFGICGYALYQVLTRVAARHDHPDTTVLYTGLVGLVAMSLVGPFFWQTPDVNGLLLILCIAVLSVLGHAMLIKALALAPAIVIQPLSYITIVWSTILGFVFFDDLPDMPTVIGATIIIASGLYTFHRERVLVKTDD